MDSVTDRRSPGPPPAPLIVHSAYSLGWGTATPAALLARARACGLRTLALTDRDNLYGAIAFLKEAEKLGVHPILGAEVTPRAGPPSLPGEDGARGIERGACLVYGAVVLLIRSPAGYASLCRILTARHLAPEFDLAEAVARNAEGLAVLAREAPTLARLHERLPAEALYAAVVRPARSRAAEAELRACARSLERPVVGSVEVFFATPEEVETHRVLAAIREVELTSRVPPESIAPPAAWLPEAGEIFERFADDPAACALARELAESCRFAARDLPAPGSLFPKLPLPEGESGYDRLYRMTQEGLRRRYARVTPAVARRLAHELEQIHAMGFTDYFVVVGDICAAARARGIPTVGRGSGASSIVSYLLGITNVDPVRYRLTFERFLHRLRRDLPDLDIDLCWRRRDEVIRHVYETYGADRVAMISTHNGYQSRGAFREAAKSLGFTSEQVDRMARAIPSFTVEPLATAIRSTPLGRRLDLGDPRIAEAIAAADRLIGLPHTLGIHCGGIVIGPDRLDSWVPLETATKGIVVTQYEMEAIEAVGLVKIDLLGNRAISTIAETITILRARGEAPPDLDAIPHDDPATARLLETGETLGCFQIESPGMRNLLRMLRTHDLDGTIAALSLIRPGPAGSGMKERFVRRARGMEETRYLHPSLEGLLASTYGVLLYEEDVIEVASAIGGFDRAVGDLLRRAIAAATAVAADPSLGERPAPLRALGDGHDPWRGGSMRELANRFVASAVKNGVAVDVAQEIWNELARFGSYAFCKAHASGYGVLAYQSTYLKAHHPGAFHAALLNNHQGMYPLRVHVEDARRRGVRLAPPCVHRSAEGWTWDGTHLRCGLRQVRGLARRTLSAILREREREGFADVEDFLARTEASLPEAEALILCGALDEVGEGPRPARLWRLHALARRHERPRAATPRIALEEAGNGRGGGGGSGGPESGELGSGCRGSHEGGGGAREGEGDTSKAGRWREFDPAQRVRHELETLEIAITAHPVAILCEELAREGRLPDFLPAERVGEREGPASVLGILSAGRRVRTKRGESMLFLTLEDPTGLVECTLFPAVYERFGHRIQGEGIFVATGRIEAQFGAPTVTVERIERIAPGRAPGD